MNGSEYLSKSVAAQALGISPRRLLELSQAGQIRRHYHNDPHTRRRAVVFKRREVEQLAARRIQANESAEIAAIPHVSRPPESQAIALSPLERPWLTLAEAAGYTGLPASYLSQLIAGRELPARDVGVRPGGRWRVSRRALDGLE